MRQGITLFNENMAQELNHATSAIGSKSVDLEISKISMELKVIIEQMRKQV